MGHHFLHDLPRNGLLILALALAAGSGTARADDLPDAEGTGEAAQTTGVRHRQKDALTLGGAVRFNAYQKSWVKPDKASSFVDVDTFRLNTDLFYKGMLMSAEYRFYTNYSMLHHAYIGYAHGDLFEFQAGIVQAPFGNLTWASHNWFFILPYYVGLEDDYDMGVKFRLTHAGWNVQAAFLFNDEGHFIGRSADSARYSYDVVKETVDLDGDGTPEFGGQHEEKYQGNLRLSWTADHGKGAGATEVGVSGQVGGLYNRRTDRFGTHVAGAVHVDSSFFGVNVKAEALYFNHLLADDPADAVVMGAYDAPYLVAKEAFVVGGGVAYTLPVKRNLVDYVQFYTDVSWMHKPAAGHHDSIMITPGFLLAAKYVFMYTDLAIGRNHPWIGGDWNTSLAQGDPDAGFEVRFNVNLGFYFSGDIDL